MGKTGRKRRRAKVRKRGKVRGKGEAIRRKD